MQVGRSASSRTGVVAASLFALLVVVGLAPTPARANPTLERQMMRLTNASRERHDLHRLRLDDPRSDRARMHSVRMGRSGDLYHTADPTDIYLRGVRWQWWGENVGDTGVNWGSDLVPLQDAFMASPEHRANVLNPGFERVAIGVVRRDGEAWVTLFFYG